MAALIALTAVATTGIALLSRSLDRPWLKRRIQALALKSAGVELDYGAAHVDVASGAVVEGLLVRSPAELRGFAPDLARIGHLEARWSLRSLLFGGGPFLTRLTVTGIALTVVVDEQGRTSFDALPPSGSSRSKPEVPLSHQGAEWLGGRSLFGVIEVKDVTLALIRTSHGEVSERTELHGLALRAAAHPAGPNDRGWSLQAGLGARTTPLDLVLTRVRSADTGAAGGPAVAHARLWVEADATSSALTAALELRVLDQSFTESVSAAADPALHVEARVGFDPAAGRTDVSIEHLDAGDGAATAQAEMVLFDATGPRIRRARGDIDVARLLRWLPEGVVPVTAARARVRYAIDSLEVGPVVRLSEDGSVAVDAEVSDAVSVAPPGALEVGDARLSVRVRPAGEGAVAAVGSAAVSRVRVASAGNRSAASDIAADLDARQSADGTVQGRLGVRFARAEQEGASAAEIARDGRLELRVEGLRAADPLATKGDIALSVDLGSLEVRASKTRAVADGVAIRAHTATEGHAPYAFEVEAPIARIRVVDRGGRPLVDAPARFEARATDVTPDVDRPAASRGVVRSSIALGELRASLEATKEAAAVSFALHADAPTLDAVRPWLPPDLRAAAPWERMAVTARSTGRVERLDGGDAALEQATAIDVERPAFGDVAARSLLVSLHSKGTALRHRADLDLRALGLAFGGGDAVDDHAALSADVDASRRSVRFELATDGRARSKLSASLSFDPSRRAVPFAIEGHVSDLGPLAPLVEKLRGAEGFDVSRLEVGIAARGAVRGVVAGVERDGAPRFEPDPARTAAVEGGADLRLDHFRWAKGGTAIETPAFQWHGDMHATDEQRTLDSRVEVGTLHFDFGSHAVDLNGIRDVASVGVRGDLRDPEAHIEQRLSVHAVEQAVVPEYPVGDVAISLVADRSPEGVVHVSELKLENGGGGSALAVTGNVDLGEGRRTLSITTSLTQDLARLSNIPERFQGRGKVGVEATVTSPDFAHFRVRAAVKGDDVSVRFPRAGVEVERANGDVPVAVEFSVDAGGVAMQRSDRRSPYSMLRFADQHPLLSRSSFLSVARVKTPLLSIAPLVGNLEVDESVISLRQFEMGVRGGSITGQSSIDWDGARSTVELHVRATGVQSSHGEPFDGNIAVAISAADRTIDGRAEILRIGERHLLDLLDLQDPLHVDPAMNRIRTALAFGYPQSLRVVFDHGFASAHLELGGLARLVSIADLRGIPMGPIFDKMLAPVFEASDAKGAR